MYKSIYEAPTQVVASLSKEDCEKWVDAFNKAIEKVKEPTQQDILAARRAAWFSVKDAPSSFSFYIKAAVDSVDVTGEIMSIDSVKERIDKFIGYGGNINDDHGNYNIGVVWGWEPIKVETKDGEADGVGVWGNLFGGDLVYDNARKSFVDGMNNLSIAGEANNRRFICDNKGCYTKRDVRQLLEISLTTHPANKDATLIWYNKDASFTKSDNSFNLSVSEYTIHKSERECPILQMKSKFIKSGFNAHARQNGCFIATDNAEPIRKAINEMGYYAVPSADETLDTSGVFAYEPNALAKESFKTGYSNGWIFEDGSLSDDIPKSFFKSLYNKGLIVCQDDGFCFKHPI